MEISDLEPLEDSISQQYSHDGMLETLLGFFLVGLTVITLAEHHSLVQAVLLFSIVLLNYAGRLWKKKITYPRLGYAELQAVKLNQMKQSVPLILFGVMALLILFLFGYFSANTSLAGASDRPVFPFDLLTYVLLSVIIVGAAYVSKARNLYWIAVLLFALLALADLLKLSPAFGFGIAALISLILGMTQLRRFLRENPMLEGETGGTV